MGGEEGLVLREGLFGGLARLFFSLPKGNFLTCLVCDLWRDTRSQVEGKAGMPKLVSIRKGRGKLAVLRPHRGCECATVREEISSFPLVLLKFLPYAPLIVGFP